MNFTDNLNIERVASLDIETVRVVEHYDDLCEAGQLAWQRKLTQNFVIPDYEELVKQWETVASLYPEFSKICAVGVAFQKDDALRCKTFCSKDEKEVLEELYELLEVLDQGGFVLIAHSGKYFDYSFMRKRFIINTMPVPNILDTLGAKPWELTKLLDTNEMWRAASTSPGSSMVALCYALDIPSPKGDMDGGKVGKHFYEDNLEGIERYVGYDAVSCFNLLKRYRGEGIFAFEDVTYNGEVEKVSILHSILNSGKFDDVAMDAIKDSITTKLTEKEKGNLELLIMGAYSKKGDRVAVKKSKLSEVKDFIKTI